MIYAITAATLLLISAAVFESGGLFDQARPSRAAIAPAAHLALEREPYIGVACPTPNSIACDRVGLAVWLRRPAARVTATIYGRTVAMGIPCGSARYHETCASYCRHVASDQPCGTYFEGFLRPAGLLNGPLKVNPDRRPYYWAGRHETVAVVRVIAADRNGKTATVKLRVALRAGWG